ncbi:hypothetical protein BU14_1714s0002 [Porphyra umbilicalis]|uniref:Uncharacterized protein n=1 Tax=Porphyra umbilicalis TaxID=2786 RepID=A0A1X6NLL9_PORUM|nr:hypothetical protein BU14_1714s0002 [Porphyra umbilicalis]|eukprot:OSX69233.1 hypothetical protein BU14_1714s0002 [Porphyra umbilicalis]
MAFLAPMPPSLAAAPAQRGGTPALPVRAPAVCPTGAPGRQRTVVVAVARATDLPRRELLAVAAAAALGVSLQPAGIARAAEVAVANPKSLDEPLTSLVQCRAALPPIRGYLKAGKWDKARTNVNYCTRVLRLSTNIRTYATALGGDAYYDALDVLSDVMNLTTQLDASAYTAGFIPADEGEIPLEAKKYMEQGLAFLDEVEGLMDQLLALAGSNVERVKPAAKAMSLPIVTEW